MRHTSNPHFGAVIFRRTSPQITNEGGLWDESINLYPLMGATPLAGTLDWRFPSNANVGFRHLQHEENKLDWQGAQVTMIGFDELTHFTESQFFYLFSRNRSTCGVRPYIRATTNPDASSWVKKFLAPWLDGSHPAAAESGEIRWMVRVDGKILWATTRAELVERYPTLNPKSCTFVRASVFDNRILLAKDPGYLANLQALPPVEQARLLRGDWNVRREGLVYPGFGDCVVEPIGLSSGQRHGGIDFGFNDPFAAVGGTLDSDDVLWIHYLRYKSWTTLPAHSAHLPMDGTRWYADPSRPDSIAELRIAGHDVRPCPHFGSKPILTGIDRLTRRIETGRLKIFRTCDDLIREAGSYHYDPEKTGENPVDSDSHALDALRYLVTSIDRGRAVNGPPVEPTPEQVQTRQDAEQALRSEEWHTQDNPAFWSGDDDD